MLAPYKAACAAAAVGRQSWLGWACSEERRRRALTTSCIGNAALGRRRCKCWRWYRKPCNRTSPAAPARGAAAQLTSAAQQCDQQLHSRCSGLKQRIKRCADDTAHARGTDAAQLADAALTPSRRCLNAPQTLLLREPVATAASVAAWATSLVAARKARSRDCRAGAPASAGRNSSARVHVCLAATQPAAAGAHISAGIAAPERRISSWDCQDDAVQLLQHEIASQRVSFRDQRARDKRVASAARALCSQGVGS